MNCLIVEQNDLSKLLNQEENFDLPDRIKYFYPQYINEHLHFICVDDQNKIIAILAISPDLSGKKDCYHIEYISVDSQYKNQGISKKLTNLLVSFCAKNSYALKYGQISEEGSNYFVDNLRSTCESFGVVLF